MTHKSLIINLLHLILINIFFTLAQFAAGKPPIEASAHF